MASTYLSRTPASAGNRKTFTISVWVKKTAISSESAICSAYTGDNDAGVFSLRFGAGSNLNKININRWSQDIATNRLFRDTSAWYHIVLAVDTTQATASDRIKLYVNGVQETSFSASNYPNQNDDLQFNNNSEHNIGRNLLSTPSGLFDGSMSHFHFTDGTAYDASTFGETDATTGIWKPKTAPSVTYGTNGFFLKFENSGSMGLDSSPNGNNFTVNGTLTQTVDTPSNVFATMNPLHSSNTTFSNGNTKVVGASGGSNPIPTSTLAVSKGKWYWETKMKGSYFNVGIMRVDQNLLTLGIGYGSAGWVYAIDGNIYHNGSQLLQTGTTISVNDIVGFYLDLDNGTLKLQKNGSNVYSGNAVITSIPLTDFYYIQCNSFDFNNEFNFGNGYFGTTAVSSANNDAGGQGIFEYSPTLSGVNYYALNTKNINTYG